MSIRKRSWSTRKLQRRVRSGGLFGRPVLAIRILRSAMPEVCDHSPHCTRPHELDGAWSIIQPLEVGWKYVDIYPRDRWVEVYFIGYAKGQVRSLLPAVVEAIHALQAQNVLVEVR